MSQNQMVGKSIEEVLEVLPESLKAKYANVLDIYRQKIIPFEEKRLIQISNIQKKNISLERKKIELARKISLLKQHNAKNQSTLQDNSLQINDLENTLLSLQVANNQNKDEIMMLKMTITELEQDLNQRVNSMKENDNKKNEAMTKYEKVNDEYNMLLSNFMKDKNLIAEKLNQLNQFQLRLHERQSKNTKQTTYIKQQWQDLQKIKKQSQSSRPKIFKNKEGNPQNLSGNVGSQKIISKPELEKKPKYIEKIISQPIKKFINHHAGQIYDIAVNMKSSLVATCSSDQHIKIFDIHKFSSKAVIKSSNSAFLSISFDKFGERLAAGGLEKSIEIFDPSTGKELHKFIQHTLKVNSVSYSFHKSFFLSGSEDKTIKAWDMQKISCAQSFSCGKPVKCLSANQSQPFIYSGHSDGSVRVYGFDQPTPIFQIKGIIDYSITSVAPLESNPNQILVSSQQGSRIYLFDLKANKSIGKFEAKDYFNKNSKVFPSPSEKYVLGGNCDGYIYYWNKQSHEYEKKISGHDYGVTGIKFIEKDAGQFFLVSSDLQGNVIVWH